MSIPESKLETWSHQGSITESANTYKVIRAALLAKDSGFFDKSFDVFLQGSYGNDTNIYAESDVDVVIRLDSTFRFQIEHLSEAEKQAYRRYVTPATYSFAEFKRAVIDHLRRTFGAAAVSVGNKAITIERNGTRRKADVIVCYEYRNFRSFDGRNTADYVSGIVFDTPSGLIINYPKQHSENLTAQHQAKLGMLKPMIRILKNMRSKMVDANSLAQGTAPSYYIEGMFFNVPANQYDSTSFGNTFCNGVNWLLQCDASKLVCANWQYYLLGSSNVQWNKAKYDSFLNALCNLWRVGG